MRRDKSTGRICQVCSTHKTVESFAEYCKICTSCKENPPLIRDCSECKETKPLIKFSKSSNGRFRTDCKTCQSAKNKILRIGKSRAEESSNRRKAVKVQSLKNKHKKELTNMYEVAKLKKLQIDHIIPLNSSIVCGLHVPWNLQMLSKYENMMKNNKFDGTYENDSWRSKCH